MGNKLFFSFITLFFVVNSYCMECAPAQKKYYTLDELLEQHRTFCKKHGIEDITEEKNDGVNHLAALPIEILAEILGHLIKIPVKEITLSKIWDSLIESESRTRGLSREQVSFNYKLEQQKKDLKKILF